MEECRSLCEWTKQKPPDASWKDWIHVEEEIWAVLLVFFLLQGCYVRRVGRTLNAEESLVFSGVRHVAEVPV